jgi:hypothetical protein
MKHGHYVIFLIVITFLGSLFKSQRQLVLENRALRQQVTMLLQSVKHLRATPADELFWILSSRDVSGRRHKAPACEWINLNHASISETTKQPDALDEPVASPLPQALPPRP